MAKENIKADPKDAVIKGLQEEISKLRVKSNEQYFIIKEIKKIARFGNDYNSKDEDLPEAVRTEISSWQRQANEESNKNSELRSEREWLRGLVEKVLNANDENGKTTA